MSVLILSACSGEKAVADPEIDCDDIDRRSRTRLVAEHPDTSMLATSLYTGDEHEHVKAAVDQFSEIADVDWRIISAGFGLVEPTTELPAYECTFRDDDAVRRRVERFGHDPSTLTKAERIQTVAAELNIPTDIEQQLTSEVEVLFVVLGGDYLHATGQSLSKIPAEMTAFAFAADGNRGLIGECQWVPSTETERDALNTVWTELKGRQLRNVATRVTSAEELMNIHSTDTIREMSLRNDSR